MSKKRSIKQYAAAFYQVTKGASGKNLDEAIDSFLRMLQKDNKLKKIDYIISEFFDYAKKIEGIKKIEIESVRKLDEAAIEKIKKIFGGKCVIAGYVNKDLIGGLRIKVDDVVLDATVKTQLSKLKQNLTK